MRWSDGEANALEPNMLWIGPGTKQEWVSPGWGVTVRELQYECAVPADPATKQRRQSLDSGDINQSINQSIKSTIDSDQTVRPKNDSQEPTRPELDRHKLVEYS